MVKIFILMQHDVVLLLRKVLKKNTNKKSLAKKMLYKKLNKNPGGKK
jgi:hypothetical protein